MSGTSSAQEKRREAAEQYRTNIVAIGTQSRAGAELQKAHRLEDGAAALRTEAAQDTATASRGARLRG